MFIGLKYENAYVERTVRWKLGLLYNVILVSIRGYISENNNKRRNRIAIVRQGW